MADPLGDHIEDASNMAKARDSLCHRLLEIGANLHPLEWVLLGVVFPIATLCINGPLGVALRYNITIQLCIFTALVQIPVLLTSAMAYVDIGWPVGVVALAFTALTHCGDGWWVRRWLTAAIVALHGGRMALGAVVLLGKLSKWTYRFSSVNDLQRYRFARVRWERTMPASTWWIKAQHDTLQQCLANSVVLAVPILAAASNPTPRVAALELIGWGTWVAAWAFENVADVQKLAFLSASKKAYRSLPAGPKRDALKSACLGVAPYDTKRYSLWTMCRHPNYFGEWCCWLGIVLASLPSLLPGEGALDLSGGSSAFSSFRLDENVLRTILLLTALYALRMFYDCLVYWTGALPAEFFSSAKRPKYREYQLTVNCFFPRQLDCLFIGDTERWRLFHHRIAGWPRRNGE